METTYIKRRSLEEIKTEDEMHLLSAKLDQTREDIRSLSSKIGTWEELKDLSQELKLKESELEIRRGLTSHIHSELESAIIERISAMETSLSNKIYEMNERMIMRLKQHVTEKMTEIIQAVGDTEANISCVSRDVGNRLCEVLDQFFSTGDNPEIGHEIGHENENPEIGHETDNHETHV